MKTRITAILGSAVIGGMLLLVPASSTLAVGTAGGPAGKGVCAAQAQAARSGGTVEAWRAFGDCEIARRLTTLDNLTTKVTASKALTSAHSAALIDEINATKSGLNALKTAIDADTDLATLRADVAKIAANYRVYVLLVPKTMLVTGSDAVLAAQAKFAKINTELADRIATAKAAGKDTTAAEASLAKMNTEVAAAVGLATPLPDQLMSLTPAQFNSGAAGPVLSSARTDLGKARDDLKAAAADAKACRDALKALA